jgi:hypothetical protein
VARILTAAMADVIRARKPLALLAEIDHPDGLTRLWTGIGTLNYNGFAWTGAGTLGSVTPVKRSTDIAIQDIVFELRGLPADAVKWLSSDVRNRTATVWLACIVNGRVVADPYPLIDALLDYQTLPVADDGTVSIKLSAVTGFYTLERAIEEVWSKEDQRLRYPADTGFDRLSILQNQDVIWTLT